MKCPYPLSGIVFFMDLEPRWRGLDGKGRSRVFLYKAGFISGEIDVVRGLTQGV